jgi:hypothetical protein
MSTTTFSAVDTAIFLAKAGLSVIPIKPDASKAPPIPWADFQTRIASEDEIRSMFRRDLGVAIVGGDVSGKLEILDIEKDAPFLEFCELVGEHDATLLEALPHVLTPSGGHHLFYRCDEIAGNQKLALIPGKDGRPEVIFETRGRGGYVLTIGCPPACHEDGREYQIVHGKLTQIPRITRSQRELLLDAARSFNQLVRKAQVDRKPTTNGNGNGARPGDRFNARMTWPEVLEPHGWVAVGGRGDQTSWRRPGKDFSFSATTNYRGSDLLYVFSTNAFPFEHETSYSKFAAHALLNYGGDYRAAARALANEFGMSDHPSNNHPEERPAFRNEQAAPIGQKDEVAEAPYIEFAPTFLAIEDPPIRYLVSDLLPEGVLALLHGEPRSRKTWAALDLAIALATGTPFAGIERFHVAQPVPVLYSSQEDSAYWVRLRAKALLRGRGIERWPETLAFSVHRGINLESSDWHELLLRDVSRYGFRFVCLDPIRRFALNVDKGPAEVRAITAYLRRLATETNAAIGLVHHDVKPPASGKDERRRSHRASGGDWFAACECPVHFEAAGDTTLVRPEDFKVSADPEPFSYRLETDDLKNPTISKLIGESTSAEDAEDLGKEQAILALLAEQKRASTNGIRKGIRCGREETASLLERMARKGALDRTEGGPGKATFWFIPEVDT